MSLADEIEKVGRAPTAKELAGFLCFSEVQSTSMSPPDGFLRSGSEPVCDLIRNQLRIGCVGCRALGRKRKYRSR